MPAARCSGGLAINLALGAVAATVTLAVLELGARAFLPPLAPRLAMYRAAPGVVYELTPGYRGSGQRGESIRINAQGLRGGELGETSGASARVLIVGDSFTFGLGVAEDESFPGMLGTLLGPRIEVINAGVPGYNLFQERRLIERRGAELAPSVIVLVLIENDLYNVDGSDFIAAADGMLVHRPGAFQPEVNVNPFAALSGPWLWLQLHSVAFREASFVGIRTRLGSVGDRELATCARDVERSHDLPSRLLRGEEDAETSPRWRAAEVEVQAAVGSEKRPRIPLVVVLFPRPEQLYSVTLRQGFSRLAAIARAGGATAVIELAAEFARAPERLDLYLFPSDHHPSPRGYALAAHTVAPAVAAALARR